MANKICPLMSGPVAVKEAITGNERSQEVHMNCEKERCGWWVWIPFTHEGKTNKIGMCAIAKLTDPKNREERKA